MDASSPDNDDITSPTPRTPATLSSSIVEAAISSSLVFKKSAADVDEIEEDISTAPVALVMMANDASSSSSSSSSAATAAAAERKKPRRPVIEEDEGYGVFDMATRLELYNGIGNSTPVDGSNNNNHQLRSRPSSGSSRSNSSGSENGGTVAPGGTERHLSLEDAEIHIGTPSSASNNPCFEADNKLFSLILGALTILSVVLSFLVWTSPAASRTESWLIAIRWLGPILALPATWIVASIFQRHDMLLMIWGLLLGCLPLFHLSSRSHYGWQRDSIAVAIMLSVWGWRLFLSTVICSKYRRRFLLGMRAEWEHGRNPFPLGIPGGNFKTAPCSFDIAMLAAYLIVAFLTASTLAIPSLAITSTYLEMLSPGFTVRQYVAIAVYCASIVGEVVADMRDNRLTRTGYTTSTGTPMSFIFAVFSWGAILLYISTWDRSWAALSCLPVVLTCLRFATGRPVLASEPLLFEAEILEIPAPKQQQQQQQQQQESSSSEQDADENAPLLKRKGFFGKILGLVDLWIEIQHEMYLERKQKKERMHAYLERQKMLGKIARSMNGEGSGWKKRRAQLRATRDRTY